MNVRCGRCGTAYYLEDAKVGPAGMAVRCYTCAHVFHVGSGAMPASPGSVDSGSPSGASSAVELVSSVATLPEPGPDSGEWIASNADPQSLMPRTDAPQHPSVAPAVSPPARRVARASAMPAARSSRRTSVWRRRDGRVRRAWIAVGAVALAVLAGVVLGRDVARMPATSARESLVAKGALVDGARGVEDAAVAMARGAIRTDRREPIDAARAALAAQAPSARIFAWQARLDVALASHAREEARLHDLLERPELGHALGLSQAAVPHAVQAARRREDAASLLVTAYAALTRARGVGHHTADVHLASAAYQLEKRAWVELRTDLENAEEVGATDASVQAELAVLRALADGATGLRDDPAAALARVPAGGDDGRLAALRAALAVTALVPSADGVLPTQAARASATSLVDALPADDARAGLLRGVLERLELMADAALLQVGDPVVVPRRPAAGLERASYEVVMQHAERARLNEHSRDAWELFLLAARKRPTTPRPWLAAGWAALDLGRKNDATTAFNRALALDDTLAEAWFGLAEASNFSGRDAEALAAYRKYLELEPSGKDAEVARRAVDALE